MFLVARCQNLTKEDEEPTQSNDQTWQNLATLATYRSDFVRYYDFFLSSLSKSRNFDSTNRRPGEPPHKAQAIDALEVLSLRASFSPGDSPWRANHARISSICSRSIEPDTIRRAVRIPVPKTFFPFSSFIAARFDIGRDML